MVSKVTRSDADIAAAETTGHEPAPGIKIHFWFGVLALIYLIDYADRFIVGVVLESIKQEFALSDGSAGLLGGSLYLGLILFAVPSGIMVDRFSRKYMVTIMTILWSITTWGMGQVHSYGAMLAVRFGVGLGEAGYNPAGYSLISAWYPQRMRATMIGIFNMAQPLGAGLGVALGGYVAYHYGWRSVFGVMAIPGIVLGLLMMFAPDYKTRKVEKTETVEVKANPKDALRFIIGTPSLMLMFFAQMAMFAYASGSAIWVPTFLVRTFSLNISDASKYVAVITLVAALGAPFGGVLSDRLVRNSPLGRINTVLILLLMPGIFFTLTYCSPVLGLSLNMAVAAACLGQLFQAAIWGSLVVAAVDLVPPHFRGTTLSFQPMFQAFTAFWAPAAIGMISDKWNIAAALEVVLVISVVACWGLMFAARSRYLADMQRQKAMGTFKLDIQ